MRRRATDRATKQTLAGAAASFPTDRMLDGWPHPKRESDPAFTAPRERHGQPGDRAPERTAYGPADASRRGTGARARPARAGWVRPEGFDWRKPVGHRRRAWDRQMARRPAGGNTGRARRTCWAHRTRRTGSRFACNAPLRWGTAVELDSPTLLGNGPRLLRWPTSAGQSGRGEGGNESRRACSARGPRVAQVRSTSLRSSGLAAAFATQLVLSSLPGDGNIPGRRWSSRDVSSARKGPRVSAVFVASFRTRAEAEGQGRVQCDPSLAARRGRSHFGAAGDVSPARVVLVVAACAARCMARAPAQAGRAAR